MFLRKVRIKHKRLETVLGYYSFGQEFVNQAAGDEQSRYVSIHEHEHAKLGTSSYFGMFQQFLAYLASTTPPTTRGLGEELFNVSIDAVRDVHEATATYCEFTWAEIHQFSGLGDMAANLPLEYRRWKSLYDGVFKEVLSRHERVNLASLISRHAMNTSILKDYSIPSAEKFHNFGRYINNPDNSPNKRFYELVEFVESENQEWIFKNYLTCYRRHQKELDLLYDNRGKINRKRSFEIHGELYQSFLIDKRKLPHFNLDLEVGVGLFTLDMSVLVRNWIKYFRDKFEEKIQYSVINTDDFESDVLLENEVAAYSGAPQTNLVQLHSVKQIEHADEYIVWVTRWNKETPFLLSSFPERNLFKSDYYFRFLPTDCPSSGYLEQTAA